MAKHLKLNIKNTQLAQAFKVPKEPEGQTTTVEPPAPPQKSAAVVKPVEKPSPAAAREKEKEVEALPPKRKARIMRASPEVAAEQIASEEAVEETALSEAEKSLFLPEESAPPVQAHPPAPKAEAKPTASATTTPLPLRKPDLPPLPVIRPKETKGVKKQEERRFDSRDRQGLRDVDNEAWRKRRQFKPSKRIQQEEIIRPKSLKIRLPITLKDLAQEMKLKSSQLIAKLFMKGIVMTLNDYFDDETVVQLLGHDFDCEISIDTSEAKRIRITDETIRQEVGKTATEHLLLRPPVVAFMGHVDHGKTSLIDAIRQSNRVASEAGAITQHIGAFKVSTKAGDVTILDTPGHEAFSAMRSRGANVTDIVILVIAGDEGIKAQTEEAMRQAKEAGVPILVALNKCDKPAFDAQKVYRELADRDLLPESWGGTTITVNCAATTGQGINELLEMIALQAEILELRANPNSRARGTILESEMHKGLGAVATVLIQNGTLHKNDPIVFGSHFGRIKTMQDDLGRPLEEAGPSVPVKITGLSDLAPAGSEFIVVKSDKEAKELAAARAEGEVRTQQSQAKLSSLEKMMAKKESGELKILPILLRADAQGSLEALKNSLLKIESKKVRLEIVNADVGEISESDVNLALASKSIIVGFHTHTESHAADLIKQKKVQAISRDVIYHIVDEVKEAMRMTLDKLEQENDVGTILVKAIFKSSQLGLIAGCQVTEGTASRQSLIRQIRNKEIIWKGRIASLKRNKEDVKEVKEGFECGVLLEGQSDIQEGDILQAYEISYLEQEL